MATSGAFASSAGACARGKEGGRAATSVLVERKQVGTTSNTLIVDRGGLFRDRGLPPTPSHGPIFHLLGTYFDLLKGKGTKIDLLCSNQAYFASRINPMIRSWTPSLWIRIPSEVRWLETLL